MSLTFLHVDFEFPGPFGAELAQACQGLAADIAGEPGLHWKLWAEDAQAGIASGEYLFDHRAQAEHYLDRHRARLQSFGATRIHARILEVNTPLSLATRAPLHPL